MLPSAKVNEKANFTVRFMNKNPFVAQSAYTPPPPLPPGPPPPQPTQPDYSAYWAAVQQQQQQQPQAGSYAPQQWPAQPRPPPEQNPLYANYGYGPQNQWQRQQQQQQQQQQQFHAPPPVVQPPPPPQAAPGYNPYQPAVNYAQPYIPQAPQAMTQIQAPYNSMARPLQVPSQPMFNPHIPPQPVPSMQQQQQRHVNHASPQHQPPAKRQRFDGPSHNQQPQQRQNDEVEDRLTLEPSSQATVKMEEDETIIMASADSIESDAKIEPRRSNTAREAEHKETDTDSKVIVSGSAPHSRIRIYFHTPVSADDSHPIVPNSLSLGTAPSDSRKGKRKKLDDDDDGDGEDGRRPPPPMNDDRSSVAASVTHSVAESGSEADWLMAAITDGEQTQPDPDAEGDEDDDERLHVSEIVEYHDNMSELGEVDDHGASQGKDDGAASENHTFSASVDVTANVSEENEANDGKVEGTDNADSISAIGSPSHALVDVHSLSYIDDTHSMASNTAGEHVDRTERANPQVQPIAAPTENPTKTAASSDSTENTTTTAASSDLQSKSQLESSERGDSEHLPEPPASPVSNTLLSASSSSTYGDSNSHNSDKDQLATQAPSANRLSISYSNGNRRMVINAEVVEKMEIYRSEGRIEAKMKIHRNPDNTIQGILVEGLSDVTKSYVPLPFHEKSEQDGSDPTLPPFINDSASTTLTLVAHLDTKRPLSEPRWVRTGDIQEWLRSMFGRMFWVSGDAADGWEKKITVVDPDPPPTIWTVLEGWAQNSPVGVPTERHRFLKTHLTETENLLEILLRLVRGERATAFSSASTISAPSVSGPLLSALSQATAHGSQQTHVSLAVLAMYQMSTEYATRASGENGKKEVDERIGEIIRCLPSHLIYKSLDGIFKEWRVEKKGR
ncbi:proteasome subunit alpha type 1 [Lentinula edodes]|uniref:Proteasome subunit alpha type 1 n=1 Tax=Lentinula edodes TaxID=5353 RepID=A0A1Q3DX98_LENED|nr:proteasome subunit alpha type 1 [Lentinula edodes]